jgi:hypothetical protein
MSFPENCFFELLISYFGAGICCFRAAIRRGNSLLNGRKSKVLPEQGIYSKPLILLCDQARRRPETGKLSAIFANSLLNSLLAGNCGRRNQITGEHRQPNR